MRDFKDEVPGYLNNSASARRQQAGNQTRVEYLAITARCRTGTPELVGEQN